MFWFLKGWSLLEGFRSSEFIWSELPWISFLSVWISVFGILVLGSFISGFYCGFSFFYGGLIIHFSSKTENFDVPNMTSSLDFFFLSFSFVNLVLVNRSLRIFHAFPCNNFHQICFFPWYIWLFLWCSCWFFVRSWGYD